MKRFTLTYYCEPKPKNPEEGRKHMEQWMAWVKSLGKSMVDPGVPLNSPMTVSSKGVKDGGRPNRLTGYSVLKAETLEDAIEIAKKCPHLHYGTIDVAEVMDMKMG